MSAAKKKIESLTARERLTLLFDEGSFVEINALMSANDKSAGVITGYGYIDGSLVYAFSQDSSVQGGAVGAIHGTKVKKLYDLSLKSGSPVVGIYDSNGAKLDEGIDALNAYGEMLYSINNLSGVVPQVSVVLGACMGTAAMLACSADFIIMSEDAELNMSIGDASAKTAAKAGVAHIVKADGTSAIKTARNVITLLPVNNLAVTPLLDYAENNQLKFVGAKDIITSTVDKDSFIEMFENFGKNAVVGLATIAGAACGVVSTCGEICPNAAAKIARFVSTCDAFSLLVVTFVNTPGFSANTEAESVRECAKLAHVYAEATTAKIAVITGEAYGAAFLALAGKSSGSDMTFAWSGSSICALRPETAVAILHGDKITASKTRDEVVSDYKKAASPQLPAIRGYIDDVIEKENTRASIVSAYEALRSKRVTKLPKKHSNMPM